MRQPLALETIGAWLLGVLWMLPLLYAVWTAFHPPAYATHFDLFAPLTLDNFAGAWQAAPFARYLLNTFMLVTHGPGGAIRAVHAGRLCLRALRIPRPRHRCSRWCCCSS